MVCMDESCGCVYVGVYGLLSCFFFNDTATTEIYTLSPTRRSSDLEIGEAAFYGPKLDVNVKPAVGNEYTLSTCQLDFCLPAKFELTYIDKDGEKKTPVVLHRAILGSLDRFMAYILEETKGNLPTWLAPVQVKVMPVKTDNEEHMEYERQVCENHEDRNVRVELDDREEKIGYRMREGQVQKER